MRRPQLRVPQTFNDLYRDLRDRRLLPVAAVLLVAIVAAPFALSKSKSSSDVPGSPVAAASGSGGTEFSVITDDPGLRDYRQRLRGDQAKDPFIQKYPAATTAGGAQAVTGAGAAAGVTSGSTESSAGSSTSTGGESPGHSGEPHGNDDGSSGGSDGSGQETPPTPPSGGGDEPQPAYVVTLRAGAPGDTNLRELSAPEPLPSSDNAIITFRGLSDDGHKAQFDVSPAVSAIFGDAKCVKGTDRCERVEIERGLPVNFVYGPSDKVYRVTVVEIRHND